MKILFLISGPSRREGGSRPHRESFVIFVIEVFLVFIDVLIFSYMYLFQREDIIRMIKEICGKVSSGLCHIYFTCLYRLNGTNVPGGGSVPVLSYLQILGSDFTAEPRQSDISAMSSCTAVM